MSINASIIDQRITGLVEDHPEWLPEGRDENKKCSAAFVLLCISLQQLSATFRRGDLLEVLQASEIVREVGL